MNAAPHINGGGSPPPSAANGASASIRFRAKNADAPAIAELRTHRQWVCWRHKEIVNKDGSTKLTKPPVNPIHGGGASHSKPEDWGTYEQARTFALTRKLAGVGFVLSERDDFTGIDSTNAGTRRRARSILGRAKSSICARPMPKSARAAPASV